MLDEEEANAAMAELDEEIAALEPGFGLVNDHHVGTAETAADVESLLDDFQD